MSKNHNVKRPAQLLKEGPVLWEREQGAVIYSTMTSLHPQDDGSYRTFGEKYYIGNAHIAPMVSILGQIAPT